MAAKKRTAFQRENDLVIIAELYLRGKSQHEIAKHIGISQKMISIDLALIRSRWAEKYISDINQAKFEELAKIDQLELTYWEAWDRSCKEKTSKSVEKNDSRGNKQQIRKEERDGNPAYLAGVQWCIERRCKILGLDSPDKSHVELTGRDGGPIQSITEQVVDLSNYTDDELQQIRAIHEAADARRNQEGTGAPEPV